MRLLNYLLLTSILFWGCQRSNIIDDLGDKSFTLVNQDSTLITFPDEYKGEYVVMGFIYTNCPDICPLITQNLIKIQRELGYPTDIRFVGITFDPERDTPQVLKNYKESFELGENFDFLTGEPQLVSELMDSVRVRSQISFTTETSDGRELYFITILIKSWF